MSIGLYGKQFVKLIFYRKPVVFDNYVINRLDVIRLDSGNQNSPKTAIAFRVVTSAIFSTGK